MAQQPLTAMGINSIKPLTTEGNNDLDHLGTSKDEEKKQEGDQLS